VRRTPAVLLAAGAALLCASCLKAPAVDLVSVKLAGLGLTGATLVADLKVENPNPFALETDSLTFLLQSTGPNEPAAWHRVTSGTQVQRYRVPARSTTSVRVPIEFGYAGLRAPVRSLLESGTLSYRISGLVFVRRPLHWRVPYSQSGNLAL